MMQESIYITYNPNSQTEKEIADDLFRKGRQNGYFIYLPQRNSSSQLSVGTKANIDSSNWVVFFSTSNQPSSVVIEEINYALKTKEENQIIVIFSDHVGENITFPDHNPVKMYVNDYDINSIEKFKTDLFSKISPKPKEKEGLTGLQVLLGVGAALLLLKALTNENDN